MNKNARVGFIACSPFVLLAFLSGLKIGGVIDWSWWWITATIWVPAAILTMWIVPIVFFISGFLKLMEGGYNKDNTRV